MGARIGKDFNKIFGDSTMDDITFDSMFLAEEENDLIEAVIGFDENGETLNTDHADAGDIEDALQGRPDDACNKHTGKFDPDELDYDPDLDFGYHTSDADKDNKDLDGAASRGVDELEQRYTNDIYDEFSHDIGFDGMGTTEDHYETGNFSDDPDDDDFELDNSYDPMEAKYMGAAEDWDGIDEEFIDPDFMFEGGASEDTDDSEDAEDFDEFYVDPEGDIASEGGGSYQSESDKGDEEEDELDESFYFVDPNGDMTTTYEGAASEDEEEEDDLDESFYVNPDGEDYTGSYSEAADDDDDEEAATIEKDSDSIMSDAEVASLVAAGGDDDLIDSL